MNQTTRERLVAAARRIFADKGYHGASVREITTAASANLGAITYHFGSKEALYEAVLESVLGPLSGLWGPEVDPAPEDAVGAGRVGPMERIDRTVAALFEHLARNPDLQMLILQHVVVRRSLPGPMVRHLGPLLERLAGDVRAGQREGTIGPGDPMLTAISLLAQPMYFGLVTRFAPDRLRGYGSAAERTATISTHARRFIRSGLGAGLEGSE